MAVRKLSGSKFPPLAPAGCAGGPLHPPKTSWSRVEIGSYIMPGIAEISGGGVKLKYEKNDAAGKHSTKTVTHGITSSKITIKIKVWTQEQLDELDHITRKLYSQMAEDAGEESPGAWVLTSPQLTGLGSQAVVVVEISELAVDGRFRVRTIQCEQWRAAPSVDKAATRIATRKIRNARTEDSERKRRQEALPANQSKNVAPSQQGEPLQSLPR